MKLLRQMCEKLLEKHQGYAIKKQRIRSIWKFYQCVALCISFLKINGINTLTKKEVRQRNQIYYKIIRSQKLTEDESRKIDLFMSQDMNIINSAFEMFDLIKEDSSMNILDFDRDEFVAILGAEVEELV